MPQLNVCNPFRRLSSLEGYGYHLVSMRQRTPPNVVHAVFFGLGFNVFRV